MRSKRIISLMLALCMVLSLIPTVTFAAPENGKEYRTAFEYEFNSQAYNSSSMIYVAAKENPAISRSLDDIVSGDQWKVWSIWANSAQLQPSPEGIDFNNTLSNKDGSTAIVIDLNITKPGTYIPSLVYSGKPSAFIADVYLTKKTGDDDSAAWKGINLNGNSAARVPFRTRVSAIPADEKLGTVDMFETEEKKGKKTKEFGEFTINDGEEGEYLLIIRANGVNENHIPMVPNGRTDKYVECELYSFILEEEVPELTPGTSTFTYNTSFDVLSENLRVASSYTGISTSWQSFPGLRNAYGAGLYNKRIMGYNSTVTLDKDGNTVEPFNVFVQENTDDWEYAMDYNSGTFALTKEHDGIYMNFTTGDTAGNFTSGRYMMLRLNVPERGKYTLWMEGNNKAGYAAPAVYFFPDDGTEIDYDRVNNKGANIAHQQCYAWFRDLAPIGYMDFSDTSAEGYVNIGTALVPEPGVYYLVLFLDKKSLVKSPATASTQSIALSGIKLAPFKEGDDADELLTLSLSTNETQLESGETQTLVSTADYSRTGLAILGADALEYKSTDEDVIKVSAEGIVTAESEGTAVVKAAVKGNEAIYDEITFTVLPEDYGNEGVVLEYITSWNALQADKLPITTKELDGESGYSSLYSSGTYTRDGSIIMNRKLMNRSATSTLNANRETVDEWRLMDFDITEPWDAAFCLSAGGLRINKPTDNMYLNFETVDYGKTDAYTTYLALRLKVPHRGTYRLGIDSNGTSTGVVPAIHFFRDDGTYLSDADILAKVKAGNAKVGYHDFTETTGKYKLVAEVEAPRQGEYFIVFHGDSTALEKNPNASGDGQYQQMNLNGIRLACIPGAVSEIKLEVEGLRDKNDAMPRLTEKTLSYTMFDKNGVPLDDLDPAKLESVVYKSSDESVATVSDGVITAHKNGETEISVTVKYDGEEATGTYNLTVADAGRNLMEHLNPGFDTEEWVWTVPRQDEEPETPKFMRTFIVTEKNGNRAMGVKFDGSVAAKSNPAGIFLKYDGHRVPVKPGRLYQLTFKFKADYEIPENASEMQLIFDMYAYSNPTGTTSSSIPFNTARSTDISKQANFRELYDDWCEVIIPVVAPTEYDGEYLYLTPRLIFRPIEADLDKAGYDGMAYFDDFCLREVGYEGVTVETIGDTTKGGGSVIVNAKPYSTLGTPISLGGNWKNADASFATSDEHVIGGFKSIAFGNAGNSDGINYMTAKASLNGLNGSATVSSTIKINGIERTGSVDVTASGFAKKLLYATAAPADETTEVGEKTRILPIGYMSDGTVADMSKGIIAYKSLTPEIISVDEETGEVTALRAGTGRVQVDLLLGTSGAQAIAEVKVIDTSAILSAQFASESMTVGYLRDAELVITGEMASGYAADVDYSNVEWIIECDADGCGEDGHEHVISIDGNMVFGNVFGGKATVKAKVTLNGATVETENALAVEVVKTDLRDYMIDFRETESNDLEIINIETDGWELNREKSHSSAANGYINTSGYTATTNATGRKVVIDAYVPYEGVYQIVFTGQYNGYNARLSDVLLDGVRIGEYSFFNGANASAEPKSLNAVYLSAGVHEFTFNPKIAGTRNSYQTLKMIRFSAKDTDFEAVGVTAENTEYNLYLNDTVNVEARLKAKDGFLYAALSENDPVVDITYTSADENIAKADAMGNVTATGSGSTVITVTAKLKNSEETFTLDIKVNVEGGSIEDYKLLPERTEFYVGEKVKLSVDAKVAGTSLPSDKMTLKFGTSDKSVAAIDGAAMTAKAAGNATITTTITYYNEPPVSFTTDITVKDDGLGSVEIDAPSFVMSPEGNGIFLTARGVSHLGKAVDISGAEVVWEIADGAEFASVDADGHVSPLGVGQALVRVTVTPQSGEPAYGETYVSVRYGKTGRTYYTDEMVAAAQENVNKYKWAQSLKKSAVAQADKYVEQLDALYELIHSEGIPRGNAVGYRNDPDKWHCRYCGKNLYTDYGHYPWRTDVLTRPWKVQCPDCKRLFPSNDFGSFYKLGLDEHGNFDRIRALENHRAMLIEKGFMTDDGASAPKTEYSDEWYTYYGYGVSGGYLCNDTYTELWKDEKASTYNKDPRTGDTIDGRRWGVDDSLGYRPGRSATGSAGEENMEVHTYISVVSHCGIWYSGVGSGISGVVNKALNSLADAYLYTGDEKYGRAGAVLVDRVADVYADYNLRPWLLRFSNSDGGAKRGQIIGSIWETGLQQDFVCAYDAFFPMYDDPQTIELLTEKAKKNNFDGKLIERNGELTVTGETIRQNIEDRLVREVFVSVKDTSSSGNFGMHQSSLAAAAVILDNHPETDEMFDWIFRYGESDNTSYSTGGGVSQRLVDNVFRDGQGNESAFGYNRLWVTQLTDLANTLARYPEYDGMSLYNNPKYIGMIQSYPYVTLVRRGVPAIGDGGGPANYPVLPDEDAVMLDSFKVLRNAEDKVLRDIAVEIAQHMYFVKGGKLSNLHYDVFTKNPESLADEVEEIIEEHGEWNYDKSSMLTGYGLGILRSGTLYDSVGTSVVRDTQRDMWIYFGGSSSHNNDDALSLGIESYGIGMTTDLGYPEATGADPNRAQWQGATLAHNTVVVNEKSQLKSAYSHKPLHYDGKDTRVKVVDVDAATAYTETDEYRRTVVMIDYDDEVSYGLDFFKILGGDDHLYSFHANSENDPEVSENIRNLIKAQVGGSYAGVNVPFGKDPGTVDGSTYGILEYPKGYTWLEDVKRADNPGVGEFWIEYAIDDFRKLSRNGKLDMHLRMTMLNDWKADEISFADGYPPRTPGNLAVMDHLEYMLVRRKGKDLNTLFTTVIEPYNGQRYIKSITGVEIAATGGETPAKTDLAKAVKVELVDGRIDYVVYAQNNKTVYTVTDGDYSFEFCGTVGVWTVRANADGGYDRIYSYLNDGTTLGEGNLKITDADAAISGTVTNFNGMENADEALVFENYIDVKTDITLPAEGEDFDAFAESLADRMFVGEREELGNSAFVIKSVTRIDDEHLRLNLGNISIVDGYKDKKDESLGYIFDVWQGQRFEIPMSYEDNAAPEFTPVDDLTVSAGSSVKVTVSASTENKDGVITYSARTLPRGAGFNADTATFNWKPDSSQIGENLVAIDARDSDGRIATMYFVVTVYGSTTGGTSDKTDGDETTDNSGNSGDTTTPSGGGGGGGGGAAPTPGNTEDGGNQTGNGGESGEAGGNTDNTDTEDEALRFTDVADDVWYHDAATWMGSKGYMSGTAPEKFSPEVATTRAMLVTILYRISGSPETSNEHGFADVEPGSYYEKAVAWAAEHGIVTGHSDTVFAPDELITREQLAAIIYRNEKRLGNDVSHSADLSVFHDGEHVSDWAHEAKSWAVGAGVINGTSETTLHPKKNATRAECATILYRIFGNR